jgi:hypothetical protein
MIALSGGEAGTVWEQLEILLRHWRAIESLHDHAGPFVFRARRSSLKPINLD